MSTSVAVGFLVLGSVMSFAGMTADQTLSAAGGADVSIPLLTAGALSTLIGVVPLFEQAQRG